MLAKVEEAIREVLGLRPGDPVDPGLPFVDLGLDSLAAVEMGRLLFVSTGIELPLTAGFDHPTPAALAAHLEALAGGAPASAGEPVARPDNQAGEPVAIVGLSCRLPGGIAGPDDLWDLLEARGDATSDFPRDRDWDLERLYSPDPDQPGTSYVRRGGFLTDAFDFDPAFFGIGDHEAEAMDPQQRLLLELAWEACEDAAVDPEALRGEPVAVFAGVATHDYYGTLAEALPPELEGWFGIGNAGSVASGRIAYALGLNGQAITVDTACSSSLVAVHLAAAALRRGECSAALAGGATVLGSPSLFVEFSRHRGLSPDGRCRAFAAAAAGTGWSEGGGFVLLERLSEARRRGRRVLAVIRGSAVNQDGASNGLSAPSGPAQEAVIRAALADAGLRPGQVDAIEAHGTATTLGDPIELGALQAVFDGDGRERPLQVGTLKSNIGHCQAAAGVAGLVKSVLALGNERLPATLHVDAPTPKVDWEGSSLSLLTEPRRWAPEGEPRRIGVSAFGISGTNAHVVLEEAAREEEPPARERRPLPFALSGRDEEELATASERLRRHLEARPGLDLAGVAATLARRNRRPLGATVVARERGELLDGLAAIEAGRGAELAHGEAQRRPATCFTFTGQGSQRPGMGEALAAGLPAFGAAYEEVCAVLDGFLERPLREVTGAAPGSEEAAALNRTEWAQPAIFAIETALLRAAASAGIEPALLLGHSIGEIAAAQAAGVLSLADACALVAARGRLMGELPAGGAMASAFAPEDEVRESLPAAGDVVVAAVNGPRETVVSGPAGALSEWEAGWKEGGGGAHRLRVSHAFHSPLMEPMRAPFAAVARGLRYRPPRLKIVSTVTGAVAGGELASPGYWVDQVIRPVRFLEAVREVEREGASAFLELGPGPILTRLTQGAVREGGEEVPRFACLLDERDELAAFVAAAAAIETAGPRVDWRVLPAIAAARPRRLPPAPFRRRRFRARPAGAAAAQPQAPLRLAGEDRWVSRARFSLRRDPWLADHEVSGVAVLPGTAYVDLALDLGAAAAAPALEELIVDSPVTFGEAEVELQLLAAEPDAEGRRRLEIHAAELEGALAGEWRPVASGTLGPAQPISSGAAAPEGGSGPAVPLEELYLGAEEGGLRYGEAFRRVREARREGEAVVVELEPAQGRRGRRFDPALLDAAMHPLALTPGEDGSPRVPFSWEGIRAEAGAERLSRVRLRPRGEEALSIEGFDGDGRTVLRVEAVRGRPLPRRHLSAAALQRRLHALSWRPLEPAPAEPSPTRRLALMAGAAPPVEEAVAAARGGESVVVEVAPVEEPSAVRALLAATLELAQAWTAGEDTRERRLTVLTRDAVAVGEGEAPDPAAAAVWGLLRSAENESPGCFLLLDGEAPGPDELAMAQAAGATQLAIREGRLLRPLLERLRAEPPPPPPVPEGTLLVTGGTRGVGAHLAVHLARSGGEHLLLASRGGERSLRPGLVEELEGLETRVTVAALDVSRREELARALASVPDGLPLRGVYHAAGVLRDGLFAGLRAEGLDEVMRAKADGAAHLDALTREGELEEFVLVSSLAGVAGSPGQAAYAAANSFLDALAARRRAEGLPGLSLVYGVWAGGEGMAATLEEEEASRLGDPLAADSALALFDAARGGEAAAPVLAAFDPRRLAGHAAAGLLPEVLRGLAAPAEATTRGPVADLRIADAGERAARVRELVLAETAAVLAAGADAIDPVASFSDLGFDSMKGLELRNRLTAATGLRLPATLVFDAPTPTAVSEAIAVRLRPGEEGGGGVGAELERLAAALARGPLPEPERGRVRGRLVKLAQGLEEEEPGNGTVAAIGAASAEELFTLIESDLGIDAE
ncbi:MAG TPA: SDR family NAD(P)-dependent oxidoreductase [Solirubrobacterales bacterium]